MLIYVEINYTSYADKVLKKWEKKGIKGGKRPK